MPTSNEHLRLAEFDHPFLYDPYHHRNAPVVHRLRGQPQANAGDASYRHATKLDGRPDVEPVHRAIEVRDQSLLVSEEASGADHGDDDHGEHDPTEHERTDHNGIGALTHSSALLARPRRRG